MPPATCQHTSSLPQQASGPSCARGAMLHQPQLSRPPGLPESSTTAVEMSGAAELPAPSRELNTRARARSEGASSPGPPGERDEA